MKVSFRTPKLQFVSDFWKVLIFVTVSACFVFFLLNAFSRGQTTSEDAFILFRYGKHLSEGYGLVYNIGEEPTMGFTEPLAVLITAIAFLVKVDPLLLIRIFSLIAIGLMAISYVTFVWKFSHSSTPISFIHFAACLPLCQWLLTGDLVVNSMTGMGGPIFLGVFALTTLIFFTLIRQPKIHLAILFGVLSFISVLARPEGALFIAGYLVFISWQAWQKKELRSTLLLALNVFLIPALSYAGVCLLYFGYLLPNSYYVKTIGGGIAGGISDRFPGRSMVQQLFIETGLPLTWIFLSLSLVMVNPKGLLKNLRISPLAWIMIIPFFLFAVSLLRTIPEGNEYNRYLLPGLICSLFITGMLLLSNPNDLEGRWLRQYLPAGIVVIITIVFTIRLISWPDSNSVGKFLSGQIPRGTEVLYSSSTSSLAAVIGKELDRSGLKSQVRISGWQAGIIPYLSEFKALDYHGLNDNFLSGREIHTLTEIEAYVRSRAPDVEINVLPPASLNASGKATDPVWQTDYVQGFFRPNFSALYHNIRTNPRWQNFIYFYMTILRDQYDIIGDYKTNFRGAEVCPFHFYVYLKRDTPYYNRLKLVIEHSLLAVQGDVYNHLPTDNLATAQWRCQERGEFATVGVFRPSNGDWHLRNSYRPDTPEVTVTFGAAGDIPLTGDWDGDGKDSIGFFHPGDLSWHLDNNLDGRADIVFTFLGMQPTDLPVTGDWDSDGIDTPGFYRPSEATWHGRNSNTSGGVDQEPFIFGMPDAVSLVGDWNGDDRDTIGLYRPHSGEIFLKDTNRAGNVGDIKDRDYTMGIAPNVQVLANDWSGRGLDTFMTVSGNQWQILPPETTRDKHLFPPYYFGQPGDIPVSGNWDGQ